MTVKTTVSTKDIDESYLRLKNIVKETPLQLDHYLSQKYDCKVYLKERTCNGYVPLNYVVLIMLFQSFLIIFKVKGLHVLVLETMLKVSPTQLKT